MPTLRPARILEPGLETLHARGGAARLPRARGSPPPSPTPTRSAPRVRRVLDAAGDRPRRTFRGLDDLAAHPRHRARTTLPRSRRRSRPSAASPRSSRARSRASSCRPGQSSIRRGRRRTSGASATRSRRPGFRRWRRRRSSRRRTTSRRSASCSTARRAPLGCTVIPGGVGQTELQVRRSPPTPRATGYLGTPSFLLHAPRARRARPGRRSRSRSPS